MGSAELKARVEELHALAMADSRRALEALEPVLCGQDDEVMRLFEVMSLPRYSRLRLLVALSAVDRPGLADRFRETFVTWAEGEGDDIARRALTKAIATKKPRGRPDAAQRQHDRHTLQAYRYASDRLAHKVRNALSRIERRASTIRRLASKVSDEAVREELLTTVQGLQERVQGLGLCVEYPVQAPAFKERRMHLLSELRDLASRYQQEYGAAQIEIQVADEVARDVEILGTTHHLYTICWNLWINSQHALEDHPRCRIVTVLSAHDRLRARMLFLDNGTGLPASIAIDSRLFRVEVTDRPEERRGRGMLETTVAAERLGGEVAFEATADGSRRVVVSLPIDWKVSP